MPSEDNLGYALDRVGKRDEAMLHYQEALRIDPAYAEAAANYAGGLIRKGQLDEAIAVYRETLKRSPNQVRLYTSVGFARLMQGKRQDAAAASPSSDLKPAPGPGEFGSSRLTDSAGSLV